MADIFFHFIIFVSFFSVLVQVACLNEALAVVVVADRLVWQTSLIDVCVCVFVSSVTSASWFLAFGEFFSSTFIINLSDDRWLLFRQIGRAFSICNNVPQNRWWQRLSREIGELRGWGMILMASINYWSLSPSRFVYSNIPFAIKTQSAETPKSKGEQPNVDAWKLKWLRSSLVRFFSLNDSFKVIIIWFIFTWNWFVQKDH